MRNVDSPYLADLFVISLRWLALFGLAISLGASGALSPGADGGGTAHLGRWVCLALPALWNGYMSALAIFNRRLPGHRLANVILDLIFCLLLFASAGGLSGGIFWVGLLPLFSAAIYYAAPGALVAAVITALAQGAYTFLWQGQPFQLIPMAVVTGFNLAGGVTVALLSAPLLRKLRQTYQGTVNRRIEGERKAQRHEHERMQALFSMIETFSSTLNYQTVMETVLGTAITALGETGEPGGSKAMVGSVMLFGEGQELEIRAAHGFISHDTSLSLPAETGALHDTFQSGEAHIIRDPQHDPELSRLVTLQQKQAALCLPLIRGMNAYGMMLFAHPQPDFFTPDRVETLQMLSNQAVIALQNARLYQDLAHEKERIVQSQDEAQKKLARDLHDGPTQSVSAVAMRINIARRLLERAQTGGAEPEVVQAAIRETLDELIKIEDLARRTTQEIRHMLFTLRPLVLETEGLAAALQTMADKMQELYQQKVTVEVDPAAAYALDNTHQTVIFYLVEEAVNNARKHAQAPEIRVRVIKAPKEDCIAVLEIIDNGVGFDVQTVMSGYDRRGSLGMINLRERAEQINGLLKIDSIPGKGTRIRVFIPLSDAAADRLHRQKHKA